MSLQGALTLQLPPGLLRIDAALAEGHPGAQWAEPVFRVGAAQQFKN